MTYFISGATGLIGGGIVAALLKSSDTDKILCPVRDVVKAKSMYGNNNRLDFIQHDFEVNKEIVVNDKIDYVIHAASPTNSIFMKDCPIETIDAIVNGTRYVLEMVRQHKEVKKMIYISSIEVYGIVLDDHQILTEDIQGYIDLSHSRSSYPMGKRMAEFMCHSFSSQFNLPIVIARLTQTFGTGVCLSRDNRVFAQFAKSAALGKDIILYTEGESMKPYLHTLDAVDAILFLLKKGENNNTYNVANPSTYLSIKDLAFLVRDMFNPSINVKFIINNNNPYLPTTKLRLDTSKLEKLGWHAKYGIQKMFEDIINDCNEELVGKDCGGENDDDTKKTH